MTESRGVLVRVRTLSFPLKTAACRGAAVVFPWGRWRRAAPPFSKSVACRGAAVDFLLWGGGGGPSLCEALPPKKTLVFWFKHSD